MPRHNPSFMLRLLLPATVLFSLMTSVSFAEEVNLVAPPAIEDDVTLAVQKGEGGAFTGVLTNRGAKGVRDVRLLVNHMWLWNNERHPGPVDDNPARSEYYMVQGDVPAGGQLKFAYTPNPPLPARTDGRFVTNAAIVGLTEY